MKATEKNLNNFLTLQNTQFVIPIYQRKYDWSEKQCNQLLNDILNAGTDENLKGHFLGSIVYIQDSVYTSNDIKKFTIIDGQQRLTTITLIYLVLYQFFKDNDDIKQRDKIHDQYIVNKYVDNEDEELKLKPAKNNEEDLKAILYNNYDLSKDNISQLVKNYKYFSNSITIDNYQSILHGLKKLMFVEISLERGKDNPQKIFETLNSTGLELSQADLIRNYILMDLSHKEQSKIYENYWVIIEDFTKDKTNGTNKLSDFIRDFLTINTGKIPKKRGVYEEFKKRYSDIKNIESTLGEIKRFAKYYNNLINPKEESSSEISKQIKFINKLEITVAYPFLLQVYDDYENSIISKEVFIDILELVQSYSWRRFIVGLATSALNKVFMNLYEKIDKNNYIESLQKSLIKRTGTQRFPKNSEIETYLKEKDIYNIQSKNRLYFLERLENYENREAVNSENLTIEHIFPQNPDASWKKDLDEESYNVMKNQWLHTIANLTLSGNNGKLGNKSFLAKKELNDNEGEQGYNYSRLWLNRYLQKCDKWTVDELEQRLKIIEERFFKIWLYPDVELSDETNESEINIFDAEDPTSKKLDYAIFFGSKLDAKNVTQLYNEVIKILHDMHPNVFSNTDLGSSLGLTMNPQNLRRAGQISELYFIETNLDNRNKFERIKHALSVCQYEDELTIKYE